MIVFFGTRQYGKVDHVPGLFYVATSFFYVQFVPLIPTGSHLMFDGTERGVNIGLSGKSVLCAWARTAFLLGGVGLGFASLIELMECLAGKGNWGTFAIMALVTTTLITIFAGSYRFFRIGPRRALELALAAGIPAEVVVEHFVKVGDLPPV